MNKLLKKTEYLEDNGLIERNEGVIKLLGAFLEEQIGEEAENFTSGLYNTSQEALEAAIEHSSFGSGIKGKRTRGLTIEEEVAIGGGVTKYRFVMDTSNSEFPNFWGDDTEFSKTTFMSNLSSILGSLSRYIIVLENIYNAMINIKKSDGDSNRNKSFPDFSTQDGDIFDDESGSESLLNYVRNNLNQANIANSFLETATGSEGAAFNNIVSTLDQNLTNIKNKMIERVETNYFENAMIWLKKWRLFWIKERMFKYSGSLISLVNLKKALDISTRELEAKESTLDIISFNTDEWITPPEIVATYYNPIIMETKIDEDNYLFDETRRVSLVIFGEEHVEYYNVFRKTLEEVEDLDFSEEDWVDGELSKKSFEKIYDDMFNMEEDTIFVYRIQAVDNNNKKYSKSKQSKILGKEIVVEEVASSREIKTKEDVGGYIYIDNKVNFVINSINTENGFLLELKNEINNLSVDRFNNLTSVSSNYFLQNL